jgi:two-component system, OmpR family, alkaline phosphatase synthesis response regulator PhoP
MESTMKNTRPDLNETETPLILVVDDNEQNLELIQAYLEDIECRILAAYSGAEALKAIREKSPDLVLLDVMMPEMSGFEVCRQVRSDPQIKGTPIIMVTALNEFGDIERGIDCGTDDFLSKPVNRWELIARVKTMLKLKHLSDKLDRTLAYLDQLEKETQPRE